MSLSTCGQIPDCGLEATYLCYPQTVNQVSPRGRPPRGSPLISETSELQLPEASISLMIPRKNTFKKAYMCYRGRFHDGV